MMLRSLLASTLLLACGCGPSGRSPTLVAAAISLRPVILDLGDAYRERNPHARIEFHFAASGVLVQQAEQGAPFDAVILAGDEEMEELLRVGVIDEATRRTFASNRLIVALPRDGRDLARLDELRDAAYARIALGSPASVPAGRYAQQALHSAGLWDELEPRLVLSAHAAQTVEYIERGEVDAAFLYRTDAVALPWLSVALEVDAALHEPIRYSAALLDEAPDPRGGRRFLELLGSSLGQVVLRNHGFGPPSP